MDKRTLKISRLIWQERLRSAAPFIVAFGLAICIGVFFILDRQLSTRVTVTAEVSNWSRMQSETGSSTYVVWVTLADGSKVMATGGRYGRAPRNGERIEIAKVTSIGGRTSFTWDNTGR